MEMHPLPQPKASSHPIGLARIKSGVAAVRDLVLLTAASGHFATLLFRLDRAVPRDGALTFGDLESRLDHLELACSKWSTASLKSGCSRRTEPPIAPDPSMADPRFVRSAILMVRHDRNGALGMPMVIDCGTS